jgi:hypothetical protein
MSVKAAAQDRVKYLLTIKRNERSPSSEIAAHHHRNAQLSLLAGQEHGRTIPLADHIASAIMQNSADTV